MGMATFESHSKGENLEEAALSRLDKGWVSGNLTRGDCWLLLRQPVLQRWNMDTL
jgi:hypothetical protein